MHRGTGKKAILTLRVFAIILRCFTANETMSCDLNSLWNKVSVGTRQIFYGTVGNTGMSQLKLYFLGKLYMIYIRDSLQNSTKCEWIKMPAYNRKNN